MIRKTTVICGLIALAILCGPVISAQENIKIGFVNAQRIIEESKAGKAAYGALKDVQEKHRQKVEAKQATIEGQQKELEKQYLTLTEDARNEKEEALRRAKKDFKRMLEDADTELSTKEKAFLEKIDREVMEIIQTLGKEKGYTLILGNGGPSILYASATMDLTNEVITLYNAQNQ